MANRPSRRQPDPFTGSKRSQDMKRKLLEQAAELYHANGERMLVDITDNRETYELKITFPRPGGTSKDAEQKAFIGIASILSE